MSLSNQRITAVDTLRGLTILFMIIVNNPGSGAHIYAPLSHAEWNGITPTDYIFPTFLFIVGISIVLSLGKRLESKSKAELTKYVFIRAVKIYLVGTFLWLWYDFDFSEIRWAGVLQRIAWVYLACSILYLYTSKKQQWLIGISILTAYLLLMCFIPVPGIGAPDLLIPEKNWAHFIDRMYLPGVMWQGTWDPEGILSTFPAIVTGMIGMWVGYELKTSASLDKRMIRLTMIAAVLFILGDFTQYIFPLNKNLWSTSFTLLVGGISTLILIVCMYLCDVMEQHKRLRFANYFGANAIFAYVLSSLLRVVFYEDVIWGIMPNTSFVSSLGSLGISLQFASLLYALFYTFIIWIPTYYLFKKNFFIKI